MAEVPEVLQVNGGGVETLGRQRPRPGWAYHLDGEYLDASSDIWSPAQLEHGIDIECRYMTPDEEQIAANDSRAGGTSGGGIMHAIRVASAKASLHKLDGKVIDHRDKDALWRALGALGRPEVQAMYDLALQPSDGAKERTRASFRPIRTV